MKVIIEEDKTLEEPTIVIHCAEIDNRINHLVEVINSHYLTLTGKINNEEYLLKLNDILYFEAVDNRVFAYTIDNIYEVNSKINILNEMLSKTSFLQISRTVILNIVKIKKVSKIVNGRMMAILINQEKLIISRAYAQNLKDKLKS